MNISPVQAQNALVFLSRTTISPREIEAYRELEALLELIVSDNNKQPKKTNE